MFTTYVKSYWNKIGFKYAKIFVFIIGVVFPCIYEQKCDFVRFLLMINYQLFINY